MSEQPSRSPSVPSAPPPPSSPTGPLNDGPSRTNGVAPAESTSSDTASASKGDGASSPQTGATEANRTRSVDAAPAPEGKAQSRAATAKGVPVKRGSYRVKEERQSSTRTNTERDRYVYWGIGLLALLAIAALVLAYFIWGPGRVAETVPEPPLILQETETSFGAGQNAVEAPTVEATVDGVFSGYYNAIGGLSLFGRPISGVMNYNGRQVQWFERARLEYFPEFAGTPYVVQSGLVGREFTDGRDFPMQQFFVSTPDLQYFPETGHAVGGVFLNFWRANGGMAVFGFPISEEFDEALPDGRTLRVQYFERARMEYHPDLAGTTSEIQLGHLAKALYLNEARPSGVPLAPTIVPIP